MSPLEVRDAIIGRIHANYTNTPVSWPNRTFDPDKDATGGHWVKPHILMAPSTIGELAENGVGFRDGVLKIQVFGPKGKESRVAWANAGTLEALFRRQVISRIVFDEPSTTEIGNDGNHYQLAVDIPFTAFVNE